MVEKSERFGRLLKQLRKEARLSQQELLEQLDEYGEYGKSTISKWETGRAIPRDAHMEAIEVILGVKRGVLFDAANPDVAEYRRMASGEAATRPSEGIELDTEPDEAVRASIRERFKVGNQIRPLSAQHYVSLTSKEKKALRAEVEATGMEYSDYEDLMKKAWPPERKLPPAKWGPARQR